MKEYDIYIPLFYNDGSPVEPTKLRNLQRRLLDHFDGLTFFPSRTKAIALLSAGPGVIVRGFSGRVNCRRWRA